nr:ribonuclease H-like domain-containing protein [Tanacetum cinerariifolium]
MAAGDAPPLPPPNTDKIISFSTPNKDFWTRHILLRCDSSGDLYPVTKPSPLPTVFVITSSSTWHQRLGHLGDDVLRTLSTRVNMVRSMWLFKHKFHANGTLSRYKAQLVANGSSQQQGIDALFIAKGPGFVLGKGSWDRGEMCGMVREAGK